MFDADSVLGVWPLETREPARELLRMIGEPDEVNIHSLTWNGVEPWKYVKIYRTFSEHHFPKPHIDCVEAALSHFIPYNTLPEITEFHSGVSYVKTLSEVRVYCKNLRYIIEAMNGIHAILTESDSIDTLRVRFKKNVEEPTTSIHMKLMFLPVSQPFTDDPI